MSLTWSTSTYEKFSRKKSDDEYRKEYQLFKQLIKQPQFGYFGKDFLPDKKEEYSEYEKRMYYYIATLGQLRQSTAHGDDTSREFLYKMDQSEKEAIQAANAILITAINKTQDFSGGKKNEKAIMVMEFLFI